MKHLFLTILLASCGASGPQTPKDAVTENKKDDVYCEPLNQDVYYCIQNDTLGYWCTYEEMQWKCVGESR